MSLHRYAVIWIVAKKAWVRPASALPASVITSKAYMSSPAIQNSATQVVLEVANVMRRPGCPASVMSDWLLSAAPGTVAISWFMAPSRTDLIDALENVPALNLTWMAWNPALELSV